jgi:hypothetical protein
MKPSLSIGLTCMMGWVGFAAAGVQGNEAPAAAAPAVVQTADLRVNLDADGNALQSVAPVKVGQLVKCRDGYVAIGSGTNAGDWSGGLVLGMPVVYVSGNLSGGGRYPDISHFGGGEFRSASVGSLSVRGQLDLGGLGGAVVMVITNGSAYADNVIYIANNSGGYVAVAGRNTNNVEGFALGADLNGIGSCGLKNRTFWEAGNNTAAHAADLRGLFIRQYAVGAGGMFSYGRLLFDTNGDWYVWGVVPGRATDAGGVPTSPLGLFMCASNGWFGFGKTHPVSTLDVQGTLTADGLEVKGLSARDGATCIPTNTAATRVDTNWPGWDAWVTNWNQRAWVSVVIDVDDGRDSGAADYAELEERVNGIARAIGRHGISRSSGASGSCDGQLQAMIEPNAAFRFVRVKSKNGTVEPLASTYIRKGL